jgi:hypothetical protein
MLMVVKGRIIRWCQSGKAPTVIGDVGCSIVEIVRELNPPLTLNESLCWIKSIYYSASIWKTNQHNNCKLITREDDSNFLLQMLQNKKLLDLIEVLKIALVREGNKYSIHIPDSVLTESCLNGLSLESEWTDADRDRTDEAFLALYPVVIRMQALYPEWQGKSRREIPALRKAGRPLKKANAVQMYIKLCKSGLTEKEAHAKVKSEGLTSATLANFKKYTGHF